MAARLWNDVGFLDFDRVGRAIEPAVAAAASRNAAVVEHGEHSAGDGVFAAVELDRFGESVAAHLLAVERAQQGLRILVGE
jgi:hypothetical protein